MESEKQVSPGVENLPLEQPQDGIFEAYANAVDADWTLTDVSLRFLQLMHVPSETNPTNRNREPILVERAYITIPWWQAKVLTQMLGGLVLSYEKVNGELKKPELAEPPQHPPQA